MVQVIAPNLKKRWSGVTSTIFRLVPIQAQYIDIVSIGPSLPEGMPEITWHQLFSMRGRERRVWHARRNIEMLAGLALRVVFRKNLALLFTSAAQRHHSSYTRWLIRKMDNVIATSRRSKTFLEVPAQVIMHGVDCERFHPTENKQALKTALDLPAQSTLVGCFGRVRSRKGTDIFVDAMIAAAQIRPTLYGVIVGQTTANNDTFLNDLKERVRSAGLEDRILFLGEQPDARIPDLFRAVDLFIAPQRWEGFGLTPLEAMASGVPVIVSTAGAFPEMVDEGNSGHILASMTPDALSDAIVSMTQNKETLAQMGSAGRKDVLDRFNIEREAKQIIEVYRGLLSRE